MKKPRSSYVRFLETEKPCPLSFPPPEPFHSPPGYLQELSPPKERPQFRKVLKHKPNYQDKIKVFAESGQQSWVETS